MTCSFVRSIIGCCVVVVATILPAFASAQVLQNQLPIATVGDPITGSGVFAIAKLGNTVYVGGVFDYLGPITGSAAIVDATTGAVTPGFPISNSPLLSCAPDGVGGWYVHGGFAQIGGKNRNRLARIKPDLSVDDVWVPPFPYGNNFAGGPIIVSGTRVYVGGGGSESLSQPIRVYDATSGAELGFNLGPQGLVFAMALQGSTLYIGGQFTSMGGQPRQNLAAIDVNTGTVLPWIANATGTVYALVLDGSTLYVGGNFTGLNGFVRNNLGAVDATSGTTLAWNPNANGRVSALAVSGTTAYAGGSFTMVGTDARARLAAISTSTGLATGWNPGTNGVSVSALAVSGGTVYAGGNFTAVGGQTRLRAAAINASTGVPMAWRPEANDEVRFIGVSGSSILLGGDLESIGGKARTNLGAFNAITGEVLPWDPAPNGTVYSLATNASNVYVGGSFTSIGGGARNWLAALSPSTGLATAWNPNPDGIPFSIVPSGPTIYVGGNFSNIDNDARPFIAAIDATSGNATTWNPAADHHVNRILVHGGVVYAGGVFTSIGGQTRNRLAALSPSTGLATAWNPDVNSTVFGMTTDGATMYVFGTFTAAGGMLRKQIAGLDMVTGLATAFDPQPSYFPSILPQGDILVANSKVYVATSGGGYGGSVTIGGQVRFLAELDPATGTATSFNPNLGGSFRWYASPLLMDGETLYVGGDNTFVTPLVHPYRRNLTAWGTATVGVEPGESSEKTLSLAIGPNPTSESARIRLTLPRDSRVRVGIFDLQGREVARIADGWIAAGTREFVWDGTARSGRRESGVYFIRAVAGTERALKRLVVFR